MMRAEAHAAERRHEPGLERGDLREQPLDREQAVVEADADARRVARVVAIRVDLVRVAAEVAGEAVVVDAGVDGWARRASLALVAALALAAHRVRAPRAAAAACRCRCTRCCSSIS